MSGVFRARGYAVGVILGLFFVISSAPVAVAGSCGHAHCWGGVAAGPDGVATRASGFATAPDAAARLERVCGGKCGRAEVFVDGCGALAQDRDGTLFAGFATTRKDAIAEATELCGADDGASCRVRVWACSD